MINRLRQRSGADTRDRIIEAAGVVFAERGFRGTTIRQITAKAGVNLAAVNYHFRDKAELYVRVLREAKAASAQIQIESLPGTPDERLRAFVRGFLESTLDPDRPAWHGRVFALEMSNPTPALDIVLRELMAPLCVRVRALVVEVIGQPVPAIELDLLISSLVSQCIHYSNCRPVIEQLAPDISQASDRIDRIAVHIADFTLAGFRDYRARAAASARS
jgi:AcrR family transcriptional regulator